MLCPWGRHLMAISGEPVSMAFYGPTCRRCQKTFEGTTHEVCKLIPGSEMDRVAILNTVEYLSLLFPGKMGGRWERGWFVKGLSTK